MAAMYVVGAAKLKAFWDKRPEAEAPLRALFALLDEGAWPTRAAMATALGGALEGDAVAVNAGPARVTLKANCAAEVVLIERVTEIAERKSP